METQKVMVEIPVGTELRWEEIEGKKVLSMVETKENRPVMERIKTLEDAMNELGKQNPLVIQYNELTKGLERSNLTKDTFAYLELRIIVSALNEGWEPQFTTDEYRYYPYFYLYTKEELAEKSDEWKESHKLWLFGGRSLNGSKCGLAYASSAYAWTNSTSALSARLALKSEELAIYCGKQFVDIWADYVGPFNRE